MLELSAWWLRLRALLEAEREEERSRFAELRGRLSLREREARGFALADVEAQDEAALAGRALVTFGRADGRALAGSRMGVGSLVQVQPRRSAAGPPPPDAPAGVVARRTRQKLAVAFDEPPPDWATEGRVVLELEPSPVTWERLLAGLTRMAETDHGRRWHAVLGGGAAPRFEARPRGPVLAARLNAEQERALELADRANDVALVHGPPGT
ncbi:MAG TPA: AAA family ATPase, partial [Anaeromyxobacteraceae bacterium]